MNLKNLSTEQLQTIIDNAPEWAVWYNDFSNYAYASDMLGGNVFLADRNGKELTIDSLGLSLIVNSIRDGEYIAISRIKSELQSRLEIDSTRPKPFTIKTQAETLVKISNIRTWEGTPEQFGKHHKAIIHWCSGGDVEAKRGKDWISVDSPSFKAFKKYRPAKPTPKTGEVWSSDYADVVVSESGKGISFSGEIIEDLTSFHKVTDNVKEYLRK